MAKNRLQNEDEFLPTGPRMYKLIERWVEAIHYTGFNQQEIEAFVGYKMAGKTPSSNVLIIRNPSGETTLSPGQWIIRGRDPILEDKKKKITNPFFSMDNGPFSLTYDTNYQKSKEADEEFDFPVDEFKAEIEKLKSDIKAKGINTLETMADKVDQMRKAKVSEEEIENFICMSPLGIHNNE